MQCLVCTGAATDITLAGFEGIVVRCPNCGDYEVADSALRRFQTASLSERGAALRKAKSLKTTGRPTITTACV
jgi:predicted RNA-binding Zn-ribbon protein involved in translation (DUF1610 family)